MLNIEAYWFFEDFKRSNQIIRDKVMESRKKIGRKPILAGIMRVKWLNSTCAESFYQSRLNWPSHMLGISPEHPLVPCVNVKEVAFFRYLSLFDWFFSLFFAIFRNPSCLSIWRDCIHSTVIVSFCPHLFSGVNKNCLIQIVYPSRRFNFQTCATSSGKTSSATWVVLLAIDRHQKCLSNVPIVISRKNRFPLF